jgi:signal peptidase II
MKPSFNITRLAWAAYGLALTVIVLDQLTKLWFLSATGEAQLLGLAGAPVIIPGVLKFSFVQNQGVSFGLFGGGEARWLLSIFSVLVAVGLTWWATKADRRLLAAAVGLVIGGAVGNVIDRIRFGYVVDFLDFSSTGLFPWVFNVADSAITVGVILLILDSILSERKQAAVGAAHEKA